MAAVLSENPSNTNMAKKTSAASASDGPSFSSTPPVTESPIGASSSYPKKVETEYHRARNQEPAAAVKLQEETSSGVGGLRSVFLTDQFTLGLAVGGVTALAAARVVNLYSPREGARVIRSYVDRILGRPSLVRESSRGMYPWSGILSTRPMMSSLARSADKGNDPGLFGDAILNPSLQGRMQQLAAAPPLRKNLLFYGPSGTGKWMAARELANRCVRNINPSVIWFDSVRTTYQLVS